MSRLDLDRIQAQLKVAIQSHQLLVSKMKNDPQNFALKEQLHNLQTEITSLSERQKSVVQLLRKELVTKKGLQIPTQRVAPHSASHNNNNNDLSKPSPAHQNQQQMRTIALDGSHNNVSSALHQKKVAQLINKKPQQPVTRCSSPPIRVPQYSIRRPPTRIMECTNKWTSQNSSMPLSPIRKPDFDATNLKKSINKKTVNPDERKKLEYMASLHLVTPDTLKELQNKRSERKRRSTANPQFSYNHFEPERKRGVVNYLANVTCPGVRKRGRPPKIRRLGPGRPSLDRPPKFIPDLYDQENAFGHSPWVAASPLIACDSPPPSSRSMSPVESVMQSDIHEDYCALCHRSGELLMCDTCNLVYHLQCLDPPLTAIPNGTWSCPKCKELNKQSGVWPGTLALVHQYITHKTSKEDEKVELEKRGQELEVEKNQLESKVKELTETITSQIQQKTKLISSTCSTQQSVEKLKNFVSVMQST
ncbi:PHD finger protein 21A [Lamellibrachia satsuma]|nr:PHD finger protein 21A [Lamellibrachia satsuma]